ncbi:MAG TPA: Do family serine endopeptidase [Xanthobacteraceae bacterium]
MTETNSPKARKILPARRLVLLASAAGLGATVLFAGPQFAQHVQFPTVAAAQAEVAMRPASFADLVEKVKPAVFAVRVKMADTAQTTQLDGEGTQTPPGMQIPPGMQVPPGSPLDRFFKRFGFGEGQDGMPNSRGPGRRQFSMAQGSGFFISADGYAVTNNHVVERGQTVEIKAEDGKTYTAKVIGTDPRTDIALLKAEGHGDFPFVKLGEKSPRVGDWVLAVGNPFGLGGTVTAGIVSASGRDIGAGPYDDFIQIDAPVNKGNSGGPTFDMDGNVIGVNTAIYSPSGGSVGIAFAIPADTVKTVVAQLKDKGSVTRGWIGVQIQPVTADIADSVGLKEPSGALVAEPQANGPAAKAGVEAGDIITSVNGSPVKDARDLAKKIGTQVPGETVKLGVFRKGGEKTLSVTLGTLPNERQARADTRGGKNEDSSGATASVAPLGLSIAPASTVGGAGRDGVVVTNVDPDGPAAERGFKTGDVILEVAGQPVSNPAEVRKALDGARTDGRRTVLLRVKSGDATRFVALPVGRA